MLELFKRDMLCASFLILNGIFLLICPLFSWMNFELLFVGTLFFYAFMNALEYFWNLKSKDYTSAFTCLASLAVAIGAYFMHAVDTPKYLAIAILIWTMFLGLIKLKKADMYHDKKSKLWTVQIVFMVLFILAGILTSINFLYGIETQILVFGYFIFIAGVFEFLDPLFGYLTKGKLK